MQGSGLPAWALWIQALGVPFLAVIVAGFGTMIALQQKRLADIRLQADLYDRRYRVLEATRKFLSTITINGAVQLDAYFAFASGTADAVFLFDENVVAYIEKIQENARQLRFMQRRLGDENIPQEQRAKLADQAADLEMQLTGAGVLNELVAAFRPAMRLDRHAL